MITKLIICNIGIFVIQSIVLLLFVLSGRREEFLNALNIFYFPNTLHVFFQRPWSIVTYMFLHDPLDIFHILFNMAYLYFFGRILNEFLSQRNILPLYITGGIIGALVFMITYNVSPAFQTDAILVGASASILAIVIAAATLMPDYSIPLIIFGPVKLKYIALIALLIDIVNISAGTNAGGHIAHLGGALTGFLYIKSYQRGYNWFDRLYIIKNKIAQRFGKRPKVVYRNAEPKYKTQKNSQTNTTQQKQTDKILDKIAQSGYDSLTTEEKAYLFKISNDKE